MLGLLPFRKLTWPQWYTSRFPSGSVGLPARLAY